MNWHKLAQQQEFEFWEHPSRRHYRDVRPENLAATDMQNLEIDEAVEACASEKDLFNVLRYYHLSVDRKIEFPNKEIMYILTGIPRILYSGSKFEWIKDIRTWLSDIVLSNRVYQYLPENDFNQFFWEHEVVNGTKLYHGTFEENIPEIIKNGLEPRYGTRGIANRSTGSAVFASESPDVAAYSYDTVLSIDVGQMKQDGYMPIVSKEEPVEETEMINSLANQVGLEDFNWEYEIGIDTGTIIFYGNIPPKYLSIVKE